MKKNKFSTINALFGAAILYAILVSCNTELKLTRKFKQMIHYKKQDQLHDRLVDLGWVQVNTNEQDFQRKINFGLDLLQPPPFKQYGHDFLDKEFYVFNAKGNDEMYLKMVDYVFDYVINNKDPLNATFPKGLYVCFQWQEEKTVMVLIYF